VPVRVSHRKVTPSSVYEPLPAITQGRGKTIALSVTKAASQGSCLIKIASTWEGIKLQSSLSSKDTAISPSCFPLHSRPWPALEGQSHPDRPLCGAVILDWYQQTTPGT